MNANKWTVTKVTVTEIPTCEVSFSTHRANGMIRTVKGIHRLIGRYMVKPVYRLFNIKSLTDLALFTIAMVSMSAFAYVMVKGFINWL